MLPKASQLSANASPPVSSTATSTRPKLGFSIDSLVGLSEAPKQAKTTKKHINFHAKHVKSQENSKESFEASGAEFRPVLSDDLRNEYRGEFRTNLFNNDDVRDMQHQMENIQQALYHINRNKRSIQHLSSPSSSSPSPSPPSRKPHSPKQHSKKGFLSPRRKSPPPSPSILQRTLNNSGLHRPAFSPPAVSSPMPTRSPTLSSPVSSSGNSTLRIPEPIHPLNSSPIPISLPNTLTNHLSNPLSNPLNFPPFGLPLAALLPQIRPGYPHPSLAPSISSAQDFHSSMASNDATSLASSSLPGLSSASVTAATSSGLHYSHINSNGLMSNPLIPNGLSSSAHSGLIQTALPASWGPASTGFNTGPLGPGSLGPSLIGPHGLGTPLPPANLPRQYPVYPWLLTRHNRLFGHRFPGPDFPTFLLPFRKPKRIRTAFSPSQLLKLEQAFEKNQYVVGQERKQLAQTLNLSETQVKVWFQNRRTKHKRVVHDGEEGEDGSQGPHDEDLDGESRYDEDEDSTTDRPEAETGNSRRQHEEMRSPEQSRRAIVGDDVEDEDGDQTVDSSSIMEDENDRGGFPPPEIGRSMSPSSTLSSRCNDGLSRALRENEDRRSRSPMEVETRRDSMENPESRSEKPCELSLPVSSMMMNPSKHNPSYLTPSMLKHPSDNFIPHPLQERATPVNISTSHLEHPKEHFSPQENGTVLLGSAVRTAPEHTSVSNTALGLTIHRMTDCSSGN